jgi:hypothetical protein
MKKTIYLSILSIFLLFSCAEDFLTQKNLYEKSDESYYQTPEDIEEALAGAYSSIPMHGEARNIPIIVAKLMSDDAFAGGGTNDLEFAAMDAFDLVSPDDYEDLFGNYWPGILRVNMILKRFDQVEYTNEDQKNQALGESYFLRAFFYFRLSQFFGPVPLKLEPNPENLPRATPEEMYGQIASDLKNAIELMPAVKYEDISVSRLGHATKWAAEALLARVFLFYTGYYNKSEIALPDGSNMTKDDVNGYLVDCIENSGHGLLDDFRNLWAYADVPSYPLVADGTIDWVGDEGANIESIFAIKYSIYGGWNAPNATNYSNQHSLYVGVRGQSLRTFGFGWGAGTVNPQLWDSFEEGDMRRDASILNVNDPAPADVDLLAYYTWNGDNTNHETGLWEKKYQPACDSFSSGYHSIFTEQFPVQANSQLWNMQDDILIRYADVLLMAAELDAPKAQEYFDNVRARAGLDSKPVTLENIKLERRHELAFEGLRYFDLLRWGLDEAEAAIESANGITVRVVDIPTEYTVDFRPETGGFLPIPKTEITLSGGILEQTPGW